MSSCYRLLTCTRRTDRKRGHPNPASPSLDMWDPRLGYVTGNVWVICHSCNTRKSNMTAEGHIRFGHELIKAFLKQKQVRYEQVSLHLIVVHHPTPQEMQMGNDMHVRASREAGPVRHDIFLTVAQFEDHIHLVLDCGCGAVLKEMDFDMLAISLNTLDNAKWLHLAEYHDKPPIVGPYAPVFTEGTCGTGVPNCPNDCIGHIEKEET